MNSEKTDSKGAVSKEKEVIGKNLNKSSEKPTTDILSSSSSFGENYSQSSIDEEEYPLLSRMLKKNPKTRTEGAAENKHVSVSTHITSSPNVVKEIITPGVYSFLT